jgi:hypothetical protein
MSKTLPTSLATTLLTMLGLCVGCGDGLSTNDVHGKITMNGEPVTKGSITFMPTSKKGINRPSSGPVNSDGSYMLSTAGENDGALAGNYTINYAPPTDEAPPPWDGKGTPPLAPKSPYEGLKPKVADVEVKAGDNQIDIELTK